jgi:DCN1-like protein 1/2
METDKITAEGVERFLNDLLLAPDSIKVLILAWKCKAAIQCEFTKDEFAIGLSDLGCVFYFMFSKRIVTLCLFQL